jgi:adenine-specific DNA-methyltransferase
MDAMTQDDLLALALAMGARNVSGWDEAEERLAASLPTVDANCLDDARAAVRVGGDPLGDLFCALRTPVERRDQGATYTPQAIVGPMVARAALRGTPARVVDTGTGSGRFLVACGRRFPDAELVGVELDPVAATLARGTLAAAGMTERSRVVVADYCDADLGTAEGPTLFIGNPPYVRHHDIPPTRKKWLTIQAVKLGVPASQLAGLHLYFFLATALRARAGDWGCFVTAAEWLDVNYGRLLRRLLLGRLGLRSLDVIAPEATPFADAMTTAVITEFAPGESPDPVGVARAAALQDLGDIKRFKPVPRARLAGSERWTETTRPAVRRPAGLVELGELCRVSRGQVTGNNKVWIAGPHSTGLPPQFLLPAVTKAQELFRAGAKLGDASALRTVIDLPADLDALDGDTRKVIDMFLYVARKLGAHTGYIATHRKAWWSVGLLPAAPILATYMARRPPAFVVNAANVRHLNIAHGLYPRIPLSDIALSRLAAYLSDSTTTASGRTYAGGLTKFEPSEMERLLVPRPEALVSEVA